MRETVSMSASSPFDEDEQTKGSGLLASQTASWPQREWLASLLNIPSVGICPSLGFELHWIFEVLWIMCHRPRAGVYLRLVGVLIRPFSTPHR
jgi:hypothetical protein